MVKDLFIRYAVPLADQFVKQLTGKGFLDETVADLFERTKQALDAAEHVLYGDHKRWNEVAPTLHHTRMRAERCDSPFKGYFLGTLDEVAQRSRVYAGY